MASSYALELKSIDLIAKQTAEKKYHEIKAVTLDSRNTVLEPSPFLVVLPAEIPFGELERVSRYHLWKRFSEFAEAAKNGAMTEEEHSALMSPIRK